MSILPMTRLNIAAAAFLLLLLLPLRATPDAGIEVAEASCSGTTCCKETDSDCIKCAATCVLVENAYDASGGSCTAPPIDHD